MSPLDFVNRQVTILEQYTANNRINIGVIGMGWQGPANTQAFLALEDCQEVAACDVDRNHLQAAIKMINKAIGPKTARVTTITANYCPVQTSMR